MEPSESSQSTSALVERYDAGAVEYATYWGPVLERSAARLLDEIDALANSSAGGSSPLRLLDVGAGTGTLVIAALRRWPTAEVTASDASAGMLGFARGRVEDAGIEGASRLSIVVGAADELPLPNASIDAAMSSFVLQLVPDRLAVLAEVRRVVRPGGMFVWVTWLDRDSRQPFRPGAEFDEAVYDLDVDEPDDSDEQIAGDIRSARTAATEMRRAGFVRVAAREDVLQYDWTLESYLAYKFDYDERSLLSVLDADQRAALERNARARLARLATSDFRWHAPVVFVRGFARLAAEGSVDAAVVAG